MNDVDNQMIEIAKILIQIGNNNDIKQFDTDIEMISNQLNNAIEENDEDQFEFHLAQLYSHIHAIGSEYSASEKENKDKRNAYGNFPGGIYPIIMAGDYIKEFSISADLGAGNGLQAILLQKIYPHKKTYQVELSQKLIDIGKLMQSILEIETNRMEWVHDDINNFSLDHLDFLYLFRPSRPFGDGLKTYHNLQKKFKNHNKPLVIFSIADCLVDFLDKRYSVFYSDGHLTCFEKK